MNKENEYSNELNEFGKEFYKWLSTTKARKNDDAWWLKRWLEESLQEYKHMKVHSCGCRQTTEVDKWSETRNYRLQTDTECIKCGAILKRIDYRMDLIERFNAGEIPPRDSTILRRELDF